jgi:endonuclease-3 related protein
MTNFTFHHYTLNAKLNVKVKKNSKIKIRTIYKILENHFGDLGWWPAKIGFEVIIGAVLTQNTSWRNAEKAIFSLKREKLLTAERIANSDPGRLSRAIRSAGYHNVKAERIREISRFLLDECGGSLGSLKKKSAELLREKLLEVKGIGPETADSILVYALDKPVFVVDAYTKRIFARHGILAEDAPYREVQQAVQDSVPKELRVMNQYHALLVEAGKRFCRKNNPLCRECPLGKLLKVKS